ncbi:MAG: PGF-pre-PGF domain-containing protein [Candidatus Methanoperedens sp.]|nr:PGF-pre-PGF domain-containing protein [Candidatus Methanoperedens sp.]
MSAGSGNTTNYFNINVNGVWTNGTLIEFYDVSGKSPGSYTVKVYAVNSTNGITINEIPLTLSATIDLPTYIPLTPVSTTASGSKNLSWSAGSGNTTNYFNINVNGVWTNGTLIESYDASGKSPGSYTVNVYAVNSTNGITINEIPLTLSATIDLPTYMPPTPSISNMTGSNWILTQWDAGTGGDNTDLFDVNVNGVLVLSNTTNKSYNATNLSAGNYTDVKVYAVNVTNVRTVNSTPAVMNTSLPVTTTTTTARTPSSGSSGSGGSSGGGSGGGGGVGTSEPYANILKYEIQEHEVFTTPVSFKYKTPELGVYEVIVTGNQSNTASIRIEVLKDTSGLAGMPAPAIVYKNLNIWIDYKRVKNASIRFKVENSWISSNGLSSADIKMYRWDNNSKEWIELPTAELNKDNKYTYFESQAESLSASFAISGIKENVPAMAGSSTNLAKAEVKQTENKPVSTRNPGAPGFEIMLSTVSILSMVYLLKRIKR